MAYRVIYRHRDVSAAFGANGHSASRTCGSPSRIQRRFVGELRPLLDEVEARFGFGAHQPLDGFFGVLAVWPQKASSGMPV
jgi:hypothetical protein